MSELTITKDGQYLTRDGREFKIYEFGVNNNQCAFGAVKTNGIWEPAIWSMDGRQIGPGSSAYCDLVEKPKTATLDVWFNVYLRNGVPYLGTFGHDTKVEADYAALPHRIDCFRIERVIQLPPKG